MKSNPDCIGPNLARLRNKARLTQEQFGQRLEKKLVIKEEISQKKVSAWECGVTTVPPRLLLPICSVLDCSILDLLTNFDLYTAQDKYLLERIRNLSQLEKDSLSYLLETWDGDSKALLLLSVLYAVQNESFRVQMAQLVINNFTEAMSNNDPTIDTRIRTDLTYVHQAWQELKCQADKNACCDGDNGEN